MRRQRRCRSSDVRCADNIDDTKSRVDVGRDIDDVHGVDNIYDVDDSSAGQHLEHDDDNDYRNAEHDDYRCSASRGSGGADSRWARRRGVSR